MSFLDEGWLDGGKCACGERVDLCPFWANVYGEWSRRIRNYDMKAYLELQRLYEPLLTSWPRLIREAHSQSTKFREYSRYSRSLFESITAVSGKSFIVDSSKRATRALALSYIPGINLKVIFLVRDGRGWLWSVKKHKDDNRLRLPKGIDSRPAWLGALRWVYVMTLSECVAAHLGDEACLFLRYEDIVSDPTSALSRIGNFLSLDFKSVIQKIESKQGITGGSHTVVGNRLRKASSLVLKADLEWTKNLTKRDQLIFYTLTWPFMIRYGYCSPAYGSNANSPV